MKANEKTIEYERPQDQYQEFERVIKEYFDSKVAGQKTLYRVQAGVLWNMYLGNLPGDGRFVYDCNTCRNFIERYGNLVIINEDGTIESALWGATVPEYFATSAAVMNDYISHCTMVTGVFASDSKTLGTPVTGVWTHLHAILPDALVNKSRMKNAEQIMAEKLEDYKMLLNAIQEYPLNVVEQAVELLQTKAMYRSNTVLGIAEWFKNVHLSIKGKKGSKVYNLIWKAVGEAPTGFCHIKSSMIGTLLDDIVSGYSTRLIMAKFEEKMNPQNYMRSQSAPTAAAIEQAEKIVEKLGIVDSLRRRYARFDEIRDRCFWLPREVKNVEPKKPGGVFANVIPKERLKAPSANPHLDLPVTTMTWTKFSKTILPTVDKISVKIDNPDKFMAFVTEAVPGSKNILQWDNPFSWYYHGGIDAEMKQRVESAGGTYDNCEIRCSLMWDSYTDLDLHCNTPTGAHIFYVHKRDIRGGFLDVDANGGAAQTMKPVENIRWISGAPNGHYTFYVYNYEDRNGRDNPFALELEVGGKIYSSKGFMGGTDEKQLAFEFDYYNGVVENMKIYQAGTSSNSETWGLTMNSFVDVVGIVKSPNMWDRINDANTMEHTFFILDGCKDTSEGLGRGFFNEILKPELREIRKTLEVYSANTPIEEADSADACGVGFYNDSSWDLTLKVTSGDNTRIIKIDRFD